MPEQERLVEQAEERILEHVLSVGLHHLLPLGIIWPGEHPKHVAPPAAVVGRVRVALLIAEAMVLAMHRDPGDRGAFSGERSQQAEQAADPRKRLEAAVGQEAVVAQANPQAAADPGKKAERQQADPGKTEGRGEGRHVQEAIQPITGQSSPLDQTRIISRSVAMSLPARRAAAAAPISASFSSIVATFASIVIFMSSRIFVMTFVSVCRFSQPLLDYCLLSLSVIGLGRQETIGRRQVATGQE